MKFWSVVSSEQVLRGADCPQFLVQLLENRKLFTELSKKYILSVKQIVVFVLVRLQLYTSMVVLMYALFPSSFPIFTLALYLLASFPDTRLYMHTHFFSRDLFLLSIDFSVRED